MTKEQMPNSNSVVDNLSTTYMEVLKKHSRDQWDVTFSEERPRKVVYEEDFESLAEELLSLAKEEQPTDEDIEKWARKESVVRFEEEDGTISEVVSPIVDYLINGAVAMRDGLITKTNTSNDHK